MSDNVSKIYPCPNCKKPIQWSSSNKFRPFCSERCRLIDFGEWANEAHVIPGRETTFDDLMSDDLDDPEE